VHRLLCQHQNTGRNLVSFGGTLLQVFLEGRGGTDGFTRILVVLGFRVTGIGHTSGTKTGSVVENNSGHASSRGRSEGGGTGGGKGDESNSEFHFDVFDEFYMC